MTGKAMFDLAAAIQDPVSTGRTAATEDQPRPKARQVRKAKEARVPTRQGARAVTAWVDPEVYRTLKLIGLDRGATTQDLVLEAMDLLFVKYGKNRMAQR